MKTNSKILLYSLILVLLVIIGGVSFAYFTAQLSSNESGSTIVADSGTMTIVYKNPTTNGSDGNGVITAHNIAPDAAAFAVKTFTVTGTNTTAKSMYYKLSLVIDNNTFTAGALTYTLTSTNTSSNGAVVPAVATQTAIATGTSTISLGTSGSFINATNAVHTYVLSIFFPETGVDQSADMSKTFAAHVLIATAQS
jgi:hypothetical protein